MPNRGSQHASGGASPRTLADDPKGLLRNEPAQALGPLAVRELTPACRGMQPAEAPRRAQNLLIGRIVTSKVSQMRTPPTEARRGKAARHWVRGSARLHSRRAKADPASSPNAVAVTDHT